MNKEKELLAEAHNLFEEIDRAGTRAELKRAGLHMDEATPIIDAIYNDLGFDLWLWLGLKQDGEDEMAAEFRSLVLERLQGLAGD